MLCKRSPAEALPSISVGTRVGEFTQVGMTFCRSVCFCFVLLRNGIDEIAKQGRFEDKEINKSVPFWTLATPAAVTSIKPLV